MRLGDGATACRWLEPTQRCVRSLRRYASEDGIDHLHDASVLAGHDYHPVGHDASTPLVPQRRKHGDPPWPTTCERDGCGYTFKVGDERQVNLDRLYRDASGREWSLHPVRWRDELAAPPGSMWDAPWMPAGWRGPDGISLQVRCPNGMDWAVDAVSSTGGRWTRTGDPRNPPTLTVSPSIAIGHRNDPRYYHSHLRNGVLEAHIG